MDTSTTAKVSKLTMDHVQFLVLILTGNTTLADRFLHKEIDGEDMILMRHCDFLEVGCNQKEMDKLRNYINYIYRGI
jgi:hypothetical protein